ncbi:hypothetical protein WAF17_01405 [Bernardetia sp. ABR2-2B]|uniref:hypothetical protein n=1 Tax=Bernardetia sp. ABR2-2B TaxID=3127472 RepID=UPI0030D4AA73
MKNTIYVVLAVLILFSISSCQNKKQENKLKKPKITIEHRKIEDFKGYNEKEYCFELVTRDRIYFAQIKDNKLLDTTRTENYFQPYFTFNSNDKPLEGEDESYKIEVIPYDYGGNSLVIFEDKKTGIFYYTIMNKPLGIYYLEDSYWIIGMNCHLGCYFSIKRIENPKMLTSNTNFDSLISQVYRNSHEEMMKVYEKAENIFSCDDLNHHLLGFIPYKNSMILFLTAPKEDKKLNEYRKEYNLSPAPSRTEYFTIQVHQDKSIDTLENSFEGTMFGMPYDGCTILPKNQNSISFCEVVLEIENDTLFVYSLE